MSSAYGHIDHLYENDNLTFGKLKEILKAASSGELVGTEKTDGIDVFLTFSPSEGVAKGARNKSELKAGGLTAEEMKERFADNDDADLKDIIHDAIKSFEHVVMYFDRDMQEKLFAPEKNAVPFYKIEIIDPRAENVINYNTRKMILQQDGHGLYFNGEFIKDISSNVQIIKKILDKLNDRQHSETYPLQVNAIRKLQELSDKEILNKTVNTIDRFMQQAGLDDSSTIRQFLMYRLASFMKKYDLPVLNKKLIIKRILGINGLGKSDISRGLDQKSKNIIRNILDSRRDLLKKAIEPIETLVFHFTSEMLKGLNSAFVVDDNKELDRVRVAVSDAISQLETDQDPRKARVLRRQLNKLKNVENISSAAEGFIFHYDGKVYKFTGGLAPASAILNLLKKDNKQKKDNMIIDMLSEMIQKRGSKYCLLSKKTKKSLGCYTSRRGAKKRERQVQYFKNMEEDVGTMAAGTVQGGGMKAVKINEKD